MTPDPPYRERVPRRATTRRVREIDYRVFEWGNPRDRVLFLLHGWGDSGASFQFVVDALRGNWFVVAPDWRGFGASGHNRGAYWFPDYLADLDVLLRHYSADAPARLVGHSMGANAAALYAGACPERVSALVNIEGFGLADSEPRGAPAHYRRWLEAVSARAAPRGYANFDELAVRIRARSPRMSEDMARYVARLWASPDADGRIRLTADPAHRWPNAVQYRRAEAEACWRAVRAPVLLVVGAETSFAAGAREWRQSDSGALPFADARVVSVPGAGHMLHFEQPARLAAVIEDFLGTLAR
ncbi:MAG TPA: alpha/beta hydrolase [Woeseiaceae bacterium]|nr:alpha/beta hydrolase [Woeseiaceae bacterium]